MNARLTDAPSDPVSHRVCIPAEMTTSGPNGRPVIAPNTMKVLVVAPAAAAKDSK